tara:strand:+ start:1603 stop:1899 length:297 start_codon:yes stop_codon:yes gene_type:complete
MSVDCFEFTKTKVLVPAGKCPVELKSESLEDVEDWIEGLSKFKKSNEIYEVSVYRYWATREFINDSDLLETALENISIATGSGETLYSLMMRHASHVD